jgi:hypothetical protein
LAGALQPATQNLKSELQNARFWSDEGGAIAKEILDIVAGEENPAGAGATEPN